jgi:hypothetical protein
VARERRKAALGIAARDPQMRRRLGVIARREREQARREERAPA